MKTENAVLMQQARESLEGKWGTAAGVTLVYLVLVIAAQMVGYPRWGGLISLFVAPHLAVGMIIFSLHLSRGQEARVENLFDGFRNYLKILVTYLLMALIIIAGIILLIVPGIIAAFMLSMTFYIVADEPQIDAVDALKKSRAMMDGHKWKLFFMYCRFIGWALLCILTLGLGFIFLVPYMQVSMAKFYDDINGRQAEAVTSEPAPAPEA